MAPKFSHPPVQSSTPILSCPPLLPYIPLCTHAFHCTLMFLCSSMYTPLLLWPLYSHIALFSYSQYFHALYHHHRGGLRNSQLLGVSNGFGLGQCTRCHPLRSKCWGQSILGLGGGRTSKVSLRFFSCRRVRVTRKCWRVHSSPCAKCGQRT